MESPEHFFFRPQYYFRLINCIALFLLNTFIVGGQPDSCSGYLGKSGVFRIVFYNVENLFDTVSEFGKQDDAFTPGGERRWTAFRLRQKVANLSKAIVAAGGWEMPAFIGLCEVENRYVAEMLARDTGIRGAGYRVVHRNSADTRGIDVAVLYDPGQFILIDSIFRQVSFPFDSVAVTRDIVYIKGATTPGDTLHLFINHWPSRWGGQAATEPYRIHAAKVLRGMTDSLFLLNPDSKIVVMGDFNDEPADKSLYVYLGAGYDYQDPRPFHLYNLSAGLAGINIGTIKYQGTWYLFEQFIVSGGLLNGGGLHTCQGSVRIVNDSFLLVPDTAWFGYKPFRTYEGFRYTGGFSDHLPVVLDLRWQAR